MQNDIKTKSTDFLPGKPSIDSVAKSSMPQANTDNSLNPIAGPTSAHVIDLKKTSTSPTDSPLLSSDNTDSKLEKPSAVTPEFDGIQKDPKPSSDITVKPIANDASTDTNPPAPAAESTTTSDDQQKTDINNLNLTDPAPQEQAVHHEEKPKKSSKFKWLLLAIVFIIVGAIVAVGVIYALNNLSI